MAHEPLRPMPTEPDLLGALAALGRAANNAAFQRRKARSCDMDLPDAIYAHARALPADLQRQKLDFIAWLEERYDVRPAEVRRSSTEVFIQRFAGSMGDDFPDDIDESGLTDDVPREKLP